MQTFSHYQEEIDLSSRHWLRSLSQTKQLLIEDYLPRGPDAFQSLCIDYHPPTVWRLWIQHNEFFRIMLHRIEPCDQALNHPHPWPSAVEVLDGEYEMGISQSKDDLAIMRVGGGSKYVMTNPDGWHWVRPIKQSSHSIMITGKPFPPDVQQKAEVTPKKPLNPMEPYYKFLLWQEFYHLLGVNTFSLKERAALLKETL
jgi:hypothetical protein